MAQEKDRPNFLFITTDQHRWDARGIHNPLLRTPTMDRIAREGIEFARAYPVTPICMPARASMVTGRSQRGHDVSELRINLSESIPVVGDSLQQAGYGCSFFGRAHFKEPELEEAIPDHPPPGAPVNPADGLWYGPYYGFNHVELHTGDTSPAGHYRVWLERNHPEVLDLWRAENALSPRTGAFHSWKNATPPELYYTNWETDRAIDWLRRRPREQPFFLWISYSDPHQPFAPPRPYCDLYDPADMADAFLPDEDLSNRPPQYQWRDNGYVYWAGYDTRKGWSGDHLKEIKAHYYGLITCIDDALERLLGELESQGILDNTHVVFTSDHGEALGDHGVAGKPPMAYECINRVALLWRHPPTVEAARTHPGVMTHLDLVPTFLDLAGAEPLAGMEGRSFAPLLQGQTDTHRDAVLVERMAIEKSKRRGPLLRLKMLITDEWKLVHYGSAPYGELYHEKEDPHDTVNLWDDPGYARKRAELTDRLLSEMIDSEMGPGNDTIHRLIARQVEEPFGAHRDPRLMETSPPYARDEREWRRDGFG